MTTRRSLLTSSVALLMCLVMLVGTTFAWFTDIATSSGNVIQSGTLDIDLMKGTPLDNGGWQWTSTDGQAIFDYEKWEPGYTSTAVLAVQNNGTLSAKWTAKIRLDGTPTILADVIDVYVTTTYDRDGARPNFNDGTWQNLGTVADVLTNDGLILEGGILQSGQSHPVLIALHMRENAGNDYQDMDLGANFDIVIMATQAPDESDSYDNTYDDNAAADFFPGFQGGSAGAAVTTNDQSETTAQVSMNGGDVSAIIPAGVKLADGANSLKLAVTLKNASEANVQLGDSEKMNSLDVHIEGVAEGNTTPMLVTLKSYLTTGINTGALRMYHVENGATVAMTQVATPTNHNEFSYDPATGDVTLALASFSEVAVIADTTNTWNGNVATSFAGGNGTEANPYQIANADQLAYFRNEVDGGRSFDNEFVKLTNNIHLSRYNFDPIGWGYVNSGWNRDVDEDGTRDDGKVFQGTFDGGKYENGEVVANYAIFDLYQDGWDLESATGTCYTYTNCGFGLFAAASNATFMNLTISGADIRVECVEAGVLVGLSQNNCTYTNIKIHNSKIANYQRPAGGLIGEVSGTGTTTITGVTIGSDVVVGSLWGDFDAPVGGVIGAYWNDTGINWTDDVYEDYQIKMTNVDVGCRLDVYNDITSAYQWHAYRRAGMLIGNTDMSDPNNAHKAYAPFLKCDNVNVYYGDWINYTYCSFSNHNERYPWVRTQAGENCTAFSNPRWGVPNDAKDNRVTDMNHVHAEGDECNVLRQFGQLYGGGQGVYGKDTHDGVETINYKYSITYINDGEVLDIIYVTDNSKPFDVANDQAEKLVLEWAKDNIKGGTIAFGGWMNAGSTKLTAIEAKNTKNIVLYPYFNSPYTASFVDSYGNILAWCLFNDSDVTRLDDAFATAKDNLPVPGEEFELAHWEIRGTDKNNKKITVTLNNENENWDSFKGYKDVTIYPYYEYNGAELIPVDTDSDGEVDYYQVAGYKDGEGSESVEIPATVNGKKVEVINMNAFGSYDDLYSVRIPATVDTINGAAFADDDKSWGVLQRETITLYFEGTPEQWKNHMDALYKGNSRYTDRNSNVNQNATTKFASNWDQNMGDGSRVFFLDANGKVVNDCYWELCKVKYGTLNLSTAYIWVFHDHAYDNHGGQNCSSWTSSNDKPNYSAEDRPDKAYWEGVTVQ